MDETMKSIFRRLLSAVVPMLLVAVSYVDPGKWAAAVEVGARYDCNIVLLMLAFNLAAILCQYLSAHIAVVTEKDLAQICSEEYDKITCIALGLQSEISMIVLDLTMILGTAHALNLIFGVDLFTCVFLTATDAILFPVFSSFSERKAKVLCLYMGAFIVFCYIFGTLVRQSGIPVSTGGRLITLSGESSPAFMSLLGASVMPQNFFLHSSLVKKEQGERSMSKTAQSQDHLFSTLCIFSGIFLFDYVLVNSAANAFYSSDILLTFHDVLPLSDQGFGDLVLPFVLILILTFSNHITALSWKLGRQAVLHRFFKAPLPGWLHHSVIRIIAIVLALCCAWNSGAEGIYQLMIYTQIVIALLLPSSVIPLFRVATSSSVMGAYKISQPVEFLVFSTFVGMLGIQIVFVAELIFGNSEWVTNLQWNMWSETSIFYDLLLMTACFSLCLVIWLAVNPLSSASSRNNAQTSNRDAQSSIAGFSKESARSDMHDDGGCQADELTHIQELVPEFDKTDLRVSASTTSPTSDSLLDLDSRSSPQLTVVKENHSDTYTEASVCIVKDLATRDDTVPESIVCNKFSSIEPVDATTLTTELLDLHVKSPSAEMESQTQKAAGGDILEPKESPKPVSESIPSATSEGPGSYRSLGGKADDGGSGAGSFSRLAGLGRASRRQLAVVLDEFWGQLFDFHGKPTVEAKAKKLDTLLGVDSKVDPKQSGALPKVDHNVNEFTGNIVSPGGRISTSLSNSILYESPVQQSGQSNISYGLQREALSLWSGNTQLLDTYMQNSSYNAVDSSERRYSSMRLPPSNDVYSDQPATIHGYQMAYLSRVAKERNSGSLTGQMELPAPKSPSIAYRDPFTVGTGQRPRIGASAKTPPGFPSVPVSRTSTMQPSRQFQGISPGVSADNMGSVVNEKKYYSLPDISGLSVPYRKSLLSEMGVQLDNPSIYRPPVGRTMQEASLYPNTLSKVNISPSTTKGGAPVYFDNFPPNISREPYSLQFNPSSHTGSLWSRQPFEQFGVSGKAPPIEGEEAKSAQNSTAQETPAVVFEAKLLQSFRICIQKLLKLEGSDWLFRQNDGADEDLIDRVGARERFLYEAENRIGQIGESQKPGFAQKNEEMASVPLCGEGCIWKIDLIISFGVWCIHRVLELSLMESRPELWGKYTYVLNRLQGIIDIAFSKPRSPMTPCLCLQIPPTHQRSPTPISYGSLPPPAKQARGKNTTAAMLLEMVKDVEIAISCRKGRTGTAAGDVAFPKGKENLASVLKRYKRRLSSKPVPYNDSGPG